MSTHPPFRKVFAGVATRSQMFALFNHHSDTPGVDPVSGMPYASEWFEIPASEYHFMLGLLPPLFQRTGMFGMSEYKAGNITSVFFAVRIRGRERVVPWLLRSLRQTQSRRHAGSNHCPRDRRRRQHDARGKARGDLVRHTCGLQGHRWRDQPRCLATGASWQANHPDQCWRAGDVLKLLEDLSDEDIDNRMP